MKKSKLPNYYSVIPASVRYCSDLSFFEIVLYSEISALSNAFGFCFASNNYFAKLYKKSVVTVSRAINNLEKLGFVRLEIEQEKGNKRSIFLNEALNTIIKNDNTPIIKNDNTPIIKNDNYNNTRENNIKYNKVRAREGEEENIQELFNRFYMRSK